MASRQDAVIKGTDATADLAVISIDLSTMKKSTLDKISVAKLGNSDQVKVGEVAIAIGNALGYGQSVTVGYISAKDREVQVSDSYNGTKTMVLLQTDAAINPGNSGGALLNANGEVIGINTVKYASTEVEGIGYAIPITRATSIINELMTREILAEKDQGYLGIAGTDVTEDVAKFYNMPIGVFISEVSEGGAAEKAGLLANDIITKVDSIEITAISQLRDYVTSKRVGTEVTVTYMRKTSGEYKEGKVKVKLGKNPNLKDSDE
jgi:serine protease Do